MSFRICMCCGEPMSINDLEHFSNPNVCASCLNLTCEMDEFASISLATDHVSSAVHAPDCEVKKGRCGGKFAADEGNRSLLVRA